MRKDWMAPYRKPAFGPTEGHRHACGHPCKCHLFPEHSPDCKKCRAAKFEEYRDGLNTTELLERQS